MRYAPQVVTPPGSLGGHQLPRKLGRYRLIALLGEGGMGRVYEAEFEGASGFRRRVALKTIRQEFASDEAFRGAFVREASAVQHLTHPAIAQVYEFGRADDQYFLAMELVDGVSLRDVLDARNEPLAVSVTLGILSEVSEALQHAHLRRDPRDGVPLSLVHRDLTPSNILLSAEGSVKLVDFGIAEHAAESNSDGRVRGKLGYIAPEIINGEGVDARADLWSLGVVGFECLSLKRPFESATLEGSRYRMCQPLPLLFELNPKVDRALSQTIDRAMRRSPNERFQDAQAFARALDPHLERVGPRELREMIAKLVSETRARPVRELDAAALELLGESGEAFNTRALEEPPIARGPKRERPRTFKRIAAAGIMLLTVSSLVLLAWIHSREGSNEMPGVPRPAVRSSARSETAPTAEPPGQGRRPPEVRTRSEAESPLSNSEEASSAPTKSVEAPQSRGRLIVNVVPWARVRVDGRYRGDTPLALTLPTGRHRVELDNPRTGQRRSLSVRVQRTRPVRVQSWQ